MKEGPTEALEAFTTHEFEGQLALVGIWAFEQQLPYAFLLLQKFFERFPDSVLPPRALMASVMMEMSPDKPDWETSAATARLHLAATYLAGEYDKYRTGDSVCVLRERLIREGIDRASFVIVQYYVKLGARSFAKQLLNYFEAFPRAKDMKQQFAELKQTVTDDLQRPDLAHIDQRWEEFFNSGKHAKFLNNTCIRDGLVGTATRIKVHARRFETTPGYRVDLSDLWLEVWQAEPEAEPELRSLLEPLDEATVEKLEQVPKESVKPRFGSNTYN